MAAIIIRDHAAQTWLTGLAGVRAKAYDVGQRALAPCIPTKTPTVAALVTRACPARLGQAGAFGADRQPRGCISGVGWSSARAWKTTGTPRPLWFRRGAGMLPPMPLPCRRSCAWGYCAGRGGSTGPG